MLKGTLNSSPRFIRTKKLYSDGDELSEVYCTSGPITRFILYNFVQINASVKLFKNYKMAFLQLRITSIALTKLIEVKSENRK